MKITNSRELRFQMFRNAISSLGSAIQNILFGLILVPISIKYLDIEHYGIIVISSIWIMLLQQCDLGIKGALPKPHHRMGFRLC